MSVREKQAWMAVIVVFLVWPIYFITFFSGLLARSLDGWALLEMFLWCLGISVVLLLGMALLASRIAREPFDAPPDELERMMEARADKIGRATLEFSIAGIAVASLWISGLAREDFAADPAGATAIVMANLLMFGGMIAGLVREIALIVQFRKTAAA